MSVTRWNKKFDIYKLTNNIFDYTLFRSDSIILKFLIFMLFVRYRKIFLTENLNIPRSIPNPP